MNDLNWIIEDKVVLHLDLMCKIKWFFFFFLTI